MINDPLISSAEITTSLRDARAFRILHRSQDMLGSATQSSGLVIVPTKAAPDLPVLTWCHGTTGLGDAGCPSAQPDPARELITYFTVEATAQIDYGIPGAQAFLDAGWAICATDYQGLGTPGLHQYVLNRTNARDAVNIVHAARHMGLGVSTTGGAMGWSQGGGAAAAVAELDDEDFGDLSLIDPHAPPDSHLFMTLAAMGSTLPGLSLDDASLPLARRSLPVPPTPNPCTISTTRSRVCT